MIIANDDVSFIEFTFRNHGKQYESTKMIHCKNGEEEKALHCLDCYKGAKITKTTRISKDNALQKKPHSILLSKII